jgi:hypothetical protein
MLSFQAGLCPSSTIRALYRSSFNEDFKDLEVISSACKPHSATTDYQHICTALESYSANELLNVNNEISHHEPREECCVIVSTEL